MYLHARRGGALHMPQPLSGVSTMQVADEFDEDDHFTPISHFYHAGC